MSLYDDASLIMYPSGVKASKIYSQKPTDGSGDLTFTRASTKTYIDANGARQTAAANVMPVSYEDGGCGKFNFEPQRTNLLLNSNTLSTQNITTTAQSYVLSFEGTGTVTLSGTYAGSLVGTGATPADRVNLVFTATAGTLTVTVSGSVLNAQVEAGTYPTSYIPTAGTTVTRVQDVFSKTGISSLLSSTALTLFLDFTYTGFLGTNFEMVQIGDGSNSNRVQIAMLTSNILQNAVLSGGVLQGAYSSSAFSVGDRIKIAVTYDASSIKMFLNGTSVYTSGAITTPTGLTQLMGGFSTATTFTFFNQLHSLLIAPSKLSDATLIALTTI